VVSTEIARYNPDAVVCLGVPFGHTRPQWILPYGGRIQLDGARRTVTLVSRSRLRADRRGRRRDRRVS
jgi:muramoyltetrapeptide carboxypeptidase LdcA involved in peptidoglycan recycling